MQHQMASRAHHWHRTGLFSVAGADRFPQGKQGTRQIKIDRFLGQHGQALKDVGGSGVPYRIGQIVFEHEWHNLCELSHPSVR